MTRPDPLTHGTRTVARQRAHRDPVTRPSGVLLSPETQAFLIHRLTVRDLWLLHMLYEHRVLTTHAIATMAFSTPRKARRRLQQLAEWGVLDRFRPRLRVGSAPLYHVLGVAGAAVLAGQAGVPARALGYRRDTVLAIAYHHTLAHTTAINEVLAGLVHATLHPPAAPPGRPQMRLDLWWSENRCRRHLDIDARPDAFARITLHRTSPRPRARPLPAFEWLFELDLGTEPLPRLAAKLERYAQLAATTATITPLLIWLPSARRETQARRHLDDALAELANPDLVPIATAHATPAIRQPAQHPARHPAEPAFGPHDERQRRIDREDVLDHLRLTPAGKVWSPLPSSVRAALPPTTSRLAFRSSAAPLVAARFDLVDLARLWPAPSRSLAQHLGALHPLDLPSETAITTTARGGGTAPLGSLPVDPAAHPEAQPLPRRHRVELRAPHPVPPVATRKSRS